MRTFDLFGDLPAPASTTVLEASAGTGKTFVLAALVTRYLAEGVASLDEMLLITFSRAATQELRERVRGQLLEALEALEERARCRVSGAAAPEPANDLIAHLGGGDTEQILWRAANLRRALADFDAATIATTHQFCQVVLKSLGVAGDNDPGVTLVDSLDALTAEIVDDVYLARFGRQQSRPPLSRDDALALAREAVANPGAAIRPLDPPAGSDAAVRVDFVRRVLAELEPRKRRLRIQGYDDLLGRLAQALEPPEAPARARMRRRWRIVMVDEFQDTDPIQWQVIERAFSGTCTLVLIGDPKQAIYAFRGGDIATYLTAAHTAGTRQTLATNWRSDRALVDALHAVLRDTELGDPDIVVRDVTARRDDHRLAGAPHNDPFRLRVVRRDHFGRDGTDLVPIGELRDYIPRDLAADLAELLGSGATFAGRALTAGDVAVIVENHRDARACRDALGRAGIPCVYYGDSDVFASPAAADWLCLLEAMEQTHRSAMVRAAALTMFFGETAQSLAAGGEAHTDRIATTLREWADHARQHGAAAVFESANLAGMGSRVLAAPGGERNMTDLAHLSQLLQEAAHRDRLSLPALAELLRSRGTPKDGDAERSRRLDSESAAVQIMTVWASKGQQFPLVYLPFAFNRYVADRDCVLYHDPDGTRCVHVGGKRSPDFGAVSTRGAAESAGEALRFAYVALTRAQSQVIAWWAPTRDEVHGGLSRLLRGRPIGAARVPDQCTDTVTDEAALQCFSSWEAAGGPSVEDAVPAAAPPVEPPPPPEGLAVRTFDRLIDTTWRRTSYSALVRAAEESAAAGVGSEPETAGKDDESDLEPSAGLPEPGAAGADLLSPMADLPGGATFGSLVHAVLETADPLAADLAGELTEQVRRHAAWWPVDAPAEQIGTGLVPLHDTPLGPLADGLTLRAIGLADRLCELDFEMPLAGGDLDDAGSVTLAEVGALLAGHLPADDPLRPYAERLRGPGLGASTLRGYLSGSIDAVLRIPDGDGHRYLVVDYKTNRLGDTGRPAAAADYGRRQLAEAMMHSDYPLQALLYLVVLHRYLRWRQPGYDPGRHLGGVLYLFLRGMCGPHTPVLDGHPAGVFDWRPPAGLVVALSELLDGKVVAP